MISVAFHLYDKAIAQQQAESDALQHWSCDVPPRQHDMVYVIDAYYIVHSIWWRGPYNVICCVLSFPNGSADAPRGED